MYQAVISDEWPWPMDPKGLIPMIWVGGLWRLPVVLVELSAKLSVPALAFAAIVIILRGERRNGFAALMCLGIVVGVHLVSPQYFSWLMD